LCRRLDGTGRGKESEDFRCKRIPGDFGLPIRSFCTPCHVRHFFRRNVPYCTGCDPILSTVSFPKVFRDQFFFNNRDFFCSQIYSSHLWQWNRLNMNLERDHFHTISRNVILLIFKKSASSIPYKIVYLKINFNAFNARCK